jgi:hypothetical protein
MLYGYRYDGDMREYIDKKFYNRREGGFVREREN